MSDTFDHAAEAFERMENGEAEMPMPRRKRIAQSLADMEERVKEQVFTDIRKRMKPFIVRRPNGGCQVLFPLTEMDRIIEGDGG